ncbi:MAG: hypothetical protein UX53_C0045G0011 [Candidatus Azambacteria bacterium GW2011_GWB2_46_37]|uniref:Uncharacterized protein n=1 Tax=Candidatus Azambacteria bacterium GW2011_GWB2_46_37 TaxID=1618618 RepID=A0A0G1PY41_9BACT|nr:MAG: hypothetical protein UX53_C0045G0011 [Candidatus Azambacteria bacterium GW2011_GWB2_46_37]
MPTMLLIKRGKNFSLCRNAEPKEIPLATSSSAIFMKISLYLMLPMELAVMFRASIIGMPLFSKIAKVCKLRPKIIFFIRPLIIGALNIISVSNFCPSIVLHAKIKETTRMAKNTPSTVT